MTTYGTLWCSGCEQALPEWSFGRNAERITGRASRCRRCRAGRARAVYVARVHGPIRRRSMPLPASYARTRTRHTLRSAAAHFGVSISVIRRWDRLAQYVSPRAAVYRRRGRIDPPRLAVVLGLSAATVRRAFGAWGRAAA